MLKNRCILTLLIAAIAGLHSVAVGDTINLDDGTILVGKIIEKKRTHIVFANSYGTFTIEKVKLKEMKKTETYIEDVEEYKRLGKEVNIEDIKKNFLAGVTLQKQLDLKEKKIDDVSSPNGDKSVSHQGYGRLGIGLGYISTSLSKIAFRLTADTAIPHGLYMNFTYDNDLKKFIKKSNMAIPGITLELTGIYFSHALFTNFKLQLAGLAIMGGVKWALPSLNNQWGAITLAALPGVSFLFVSNDYVKLTRWIFPFTIALDLGYEYSFGLPSIFLRLRYMYIDDIDIGFHSIGFNIGAAFKI